LQQKSESTNMDLPHVTCYITSSDLGSSDIISSVKWVGYTVCI